MHRFLVRQPALAKQARIHQGMARLRIDFRSALHCGSTHLRLTRIIFACLRAQSKPPCIEWLFFGPKLETGEADWRQFDVQSARIAEVAQGPLSGPAAFPAGDTLQDTNTGKPRPQSHGAVEKPQGVKASLALHFSVGHAQEGCHKAISRR
jgi:hypothetical protein